MKNILIILTFLTSFKANSQINIRYLEEERKVVNDVFFKLIDSSYFYHIRIWDFPFDLENEGLDFYNLSENRDSAKKLFNLYWSPQRFYPIDLYDELLRTNGQKEQLIKLKNRFNHIRDSLKNCIDKRELVIEISDRLNAIECTTDNGTILIKSLNRICKRKLDKHNKFIKKLIEEDLSERKFCFDSIYHDRFIFRKNISEPIDYTKEKYIGSITISRILFDNEFENGIFYYSEYESPLSARGAFYIIKKENGKWIIKQQICNWIS